MAFIIWFRHLPHIHMNLSEWTPFIQNDWYRIHYMKFVYLLQVTLFLLPNFFGARFTHQNIFFLIAISILVFIVHECLHILVVYKEGDISLTFRGVFFWLHTNAVLSKPRFWIFMTLPFIGLTIVPAVLSFSVSGDLQSILLFVSWINAIISAADIYNSILIAIKPKNSVFCRGYFQVKS